MSARLRWGVLAIAVYVAAALALVAVRPFGARPLFDGLAPPVPYRFVSPPPDLKAQNEAPLPGNGLLDLVGKGSAANSIGTQDGQMLIVFQKNTFALRKGEKTVTVRIAARIPPPPKNVSGSLAVTGNAYVVTAAYTKSKATAKPLQTMTAVIRYPATGKAIVWRNGSTWRPLHTQISKASLQLFAETDNLGMFAAAGKPDKGKPWIPYVAIGLGVTAGVIGYLQGVQSARRRKRRKA